MDLDEALADVVARSGDRLLRVAYQLTHDRAYKNTSKVINGYQVVVQRGTIGGLAEQDVCAAHASGFWASIEEFGPHPTIGVASLFKHLRFPGTNPANWTSNPIG